MKNYQTEALKLAKNSILENFGEANLNKYIVENKELREEKACFVTLKIGKKNLRGCIGNIVAQKKLYQDIISNAKSAAFSDPRFSALDYDELDNLFIEITILTPLQEKKIIDIQNLLKYLGEKKPGLVISLGSRQATFLPSVWKEINNSLDFVNHLIFKAGISDKEFVNHFNKIKFMIYFGEEFGDWFKDI